MPNTQRENANHFNMTHCRWGHNWEVKQGEDGVLRGFCWLTPSPRVGDRVTWRTTYGTATGVITEAEWMMNVDDMYRIAVEVEERVEASIANQDAGTSARITPRRYNH